MPHKKEVATQFRGMPAVMVGLSAFLATFDVTALSLALPAIGETFRIGVADLIWIMSAYSLTLTVMLISAGAVADRWGARPTLISGAFIFSIASLLCAAAWSYEALIAGRVIQGIGAAGISCGGYALVSRLYSEKADRIKAFGIVGTIGGSALAIGPGLGGLIAGALGWRALFLIKLPVCAFIVFGAATIADKTERSQPRKFDVGGIILFSVFISMLSWSLLFGPPSVDAAIWWGAICALLVLFVIVELRVGYPAIDVSLFSRGEFSGLAMVPISLALSYWALMIFMPIYLEGPLGLPKSWTSYIVLFFTIPMFLVPYLVTGLAGRTESYIFFPSGLATVSLGCALMACGALFHGLYLSVVGMLIAGIGAAAIQTQVSGALIACAPEERAGSVSAITTVLRQGGFAVGSAVLSRILGSSFSPQGQALGSFFVLFLACALFAAAGAFGSFLLIGRRRREVQTPA